MCKISLIHVFIHLYLLSMHPLIMDQFFKGINKSERHEWAMNKKLPKHMNVYKEGDRCQIWLFATCCKWLSPAFYLNFYTERQLDRAWPYNYKYILVKTTVKMVIL